MQRLNLRYKLLVITVIALLVWAVAADIPFSFRAGDVISAEQVNQNFAALNNGKQELIKGTCAAGSSIRIIAADGSVTCEVDDIGNGSNSGVDAINGQTGAITLQAGDNITIDDSQKGQLKISSSSGGSTYTADDSSLQLSGTTFSIKDGGVTDSKIALPLRLTDTSPEVLTVTNFFNGVGVYGISGGTQLTTPIAAGVLGYSLDNVGVYGYTRHKIGVFGGSNDDGIGVKGQAVNGVAVDGFSSGSTGVSGRSQNGNGVYGTSSFGFGVYGESSSNNAVYGVTPGTNTNAVAIAGTSTNGYAAYFEAGNGSGGFATCTFHAGTTNWACSSDKNLKDNFEPVNSVQILEAVAHMPVTTWTMKGSAIRQMGPTAQDFYAAFNLGDSDKMINNTDAQGVALAAIQGLYKIVQEQAQVMQVQQQTLQEQDKRIADLEARLALTSEIPKQ